MWKHVGLTQIFFGLDVILAVLYYVHLCVPQFLYSYLPMLSEAGIRSLIVLFKGLSMLANYFLNPHAALLLALGVIQITCGIAIQLGSDFVLFQRDGEIDEESSEIRGELRRLITNTSSSIERYL